MNGNVRVERKKDVADVVHSVINDRPADPSEVTASLHRLMNKADRSDNLFRDALREILGANMNLALTVKRLVNDKLSDRARIEALEVEVRRLTTLTT